MSPPPTPEQIGWLPADTDLAHRLPKGFSLGAATSAYQIEGAAGGRGACIWDTFAARGHTAEGHNGDVACDHATFWRNDIGLMADLGLRDYRLSLSWARLQPTGKGALSPEGVRFYRELLTELVARGIRPWVTLYHWDLPQPLEDVGGWPARDTAYQFAEFAGRVVDLLGDLAGDWITLNEPWCSAFLGYGNGEHAPGRSSPTDAVAAAHHLNLAHGLAAQAIRASHPDLRIGITNLVTDLDPASDSDLDHRATARLDAQHNRIFLGPVYVGSYDDEVLAIHEPFGLSADGPRSLIQDGDLKAIAARTDFVGLNHYHRFLVAHDTSADSYLRVRSSLPGPPSTEMGWPVCPESMHRVLERVSGEYSSLPIFITENGAAYHDDLDSSGIVYDPERIAYLRAYLGAVADAVDSGIDVQGYFVWSLMDNFEWGLGYTRRFGLVHIDYETQRRTPKSSAWWYRELLGQHS